MSLADVPQLDLATLLVRQSGVVSRRQLHALGFTDGRIRAQLAAGRWQRPQPGLSGVYVAHNGPVDDTTRCWGFLLYAGRGAVLAMDTAAWLWGVTDEPSPQVHVMAPVSRRIAPQPGLRVHLRVHLGERTHPVRLPPVTTLEDTVIDLADAALSGTRAIDLVTSACQRRLTTAARLAGVVAARKKLRRRDLLSEVLGEVVEGVQSPLERLYLRGVERAHGLPRGERNRAEGPRGGRRYRDVRYRRYGLVVELDGQAAHPLELAHLDQRRDNDLLLAEGAATLRYGWRPVTDDPCGVAREVARVLSRGGWTGRPGHCGPGCTAS